MPTIPIAHRPWPLPARPWVMSMVWRDLAFLHWPVSVATLRPLIPEGLAIDTWDGTAWLGVVPFAMESVCPRFTPRIPPISDFPELNVRTYVTAGGKPGVWFFSLDAASALAVRTARAVFHLPYFDARIRCEAEEESVDYDSLRTHRGALAGEFRARYRPTAGPQSGCPGTIEHWLTERYCLYSAHRGKLFRGEIHHEPWPLQSAEVEIQTNSVGEIAGCPLIGSPALAHYAKRLFVQAWLIQPTV
ncbi:MAG: DUF2071 domain-containing protein [Bryobacterales bacterium]|nr:DUF2071 domain-containing protein [Bryobacterales bacterium]